MVMVPREKIQAVNLDQDPEKVIEQIIEKTVFPGARLPRES